jgi:predicted metalloprotease with PDZ domain
MCLDLLFVTESNGKTNLVDLMQYLATKYGKNVPFKDDELFKVIAEFAETKTSPAGAQKIANFLAKNVDGIEPLPYKELLEKAGITYLEEGEAEELSKFGLTNLQKGFAFDFKEKRIKIASAEYMDDFGKNTLQLQPGDLLKSWNGKELDMNNVSTVLGLHEMNAKEGDELTIGILRKQDDGSFKEIVSKGVIKPIIVKQKHIFQAQPNPSTEQINVRKAWLGQ